LTHLAGAIEMREQFRELAAWNSDSGPVKDSPAFRILIRGVQAAIDDDGGTSNPI
jgi:hypothetical protein